MKAGGSPGDFVKPGRAELLGRTWSRMDGALQAGFLMAAGSSGEGLRWEV